MKYEALHSITRKCTSYRRQILHTDPQKACKVGISKQSLEIRLRFILT